MRQSFTSYDDCAAVWVQQSQQHGHTPESRMFFEGPVIYSYGTHWEIARFHTDSNGGRYVLVNDSFCAYGTGEGSSPTTARQTNEVRQALWRAGIRWANTNDTHSTLDQLREEYSKRLADSYSKLKRKRQLWSVKTHQSLFDYCNQRAEAFGWPKWELPEDWDDLCVTIAQRKLADEQRRKAPDYEPTGFCVQRDERKRRANITKRILTINNQLTEDIQARVLDELNWKEKEQLVDSPFPAAAVQVLLEQAAARREAAKAAKVAA